MSDRLPPPPADVRGHAAANAARGLATAEAGQPEVTPKKQATETIAARAGALLDEVDFPEFVASLVHGTFDAIVDASIRQMESYADLVSAVAKSSEQFTDENVTSNQTRDWLVQKYPQDLLLDLSDTPKLLPKPQHAEGDDERRSPEWLEEFQLGGEELTPELIEEQLVPRARAHVGQGRQQMLATMVLLGMNRVVVRDGSISAHLNFRAAAADRAKVEYAVSDDPQGGATWGARGSSTYVLPSTKVSTVGVNVQANAQLSAALTGEVKINFASETLPLERFADEAKRTLLERRAKSGPPAVASPATPAPEPPAPPAAALPKGTP